MQGMHPRDADHNAAKLHTKRRVYMKNTKRMLKQAAAGLLAAAMLMTVRAGTRRQKRVTRKLNHLLTAKKDKPKSTHPRKWN